jgi:hypothetical protein
MRTEFSPIVKATDIARRITGAAVMLHGEPYVGHERNLVEVQSQNPVVQAPNQSRDRNSNQFDVPAYQSQSRPQR